MPKKSVLGHPDNVPSLAREGFSLDQIFTFTASSGMILPTWYDILYPGETIKGSPNFLLRSNAFLAPAMADIDCFVDLFFVPFSKLFSAFGEWIYQIDDIRSDFNKLSQFTDHLPYICSHNYQDSPWGDLDGQMFDSWSYADLRGVNFGYSTFGRFDRYGRGMYRLLSHLGRNPQSLFANLFEIYGTQDEVQNSGILTEYQPLMYDLSSPNYCPYFEAAYQACYMDYYRNSLFENNDIKSYNMDSVFNDGSGAMENPFEVSSGRHGMFELRYRWRSKDYFTATQCAPMLQPFGMMPNAYGNLLKVNQWLTSGVYSGANANGGFGQFSSDPGNSGQITNYGLLFQSKGSGTASISGSATLNGTTGNDIRKWSVYNSTSPLVNNGSISLFSDAQGSNLRGQIQDGNSPSIIHTHDVTGSASLSSTASVSGVNVQAILSTAQVRTMFAIEKINRITARAGKHYDQQTLAHFGYKVPQVSSGEVYKIGSWHTTVGIQKVTSTADTQGAALGEQAAVGYAILDGSKKGIKFTAPCEGIVMCLWSCAPRYKYLYMHDKLGYKSNLWDFYKPSLDNLGMQPLFQYEQGVPNGHTSLSNTVAGWQWRFMESKVKADHVTPVFATNTKNPWSMVSMPETYMNNGLVSPCDLNNLFNTQYDPSGDWPETGSQQSHETSFGNYPTVFLRDPFTIDFFMDMTKVSTMSTFGDMPLNGI